MTDFDLDRLGDLWRQRPTPEELESLRRTAETVQRRARWAQYIDIGAAVIVAGLVLILVLSNPRVDTMLVGGAAILLLLVSQARNRRLRLEELRGLAGTADQMLEQSISRTRATLKRTRLQLLAIGPAFLLGLGIAALTDRSSGTSYARIMAEPALGFWVAGGGLILLAVVSFTRSIRRSRQELDRLIALRQAFHAENASHPTE